MVNVTKDNFLEQSNDFLKHLPTAAFIAIDEEMTGISLPNGGNGNGGFGSAQRAPKDETPGQRYSAELKQIPERYAIIQFGISLFHSTATDPVVVSSSSPSSSAAAAARNAAGAHNNNTNIEWKARRYNFYMFPDEKSRRGDVVMNPGAVHFLNQHHMSFDIWTKQGISFCTLDEAREILQTYVATTKKSDAQAAADDAKTCPPTLQDAYRPRVVELRRTEDIDFFSRTMASVREWLDAALPPTTTMQHHHIHNIHPGAPPQQQQQQQLEGTSLLLPECSAFMRRALYESIEQEYPSLVLENAGATSLSSLSSPGQQPGNRNQIRVWRLTEEEKLHRRLRLRRLAWENVLVHQIGMTRIFAALARVCSGLSLDRHSVLFAPSIDQVDCWDEQHVAAVSFVPSSQMEQPKNDSINANISSGTTTGRKIPIVVHNGFMDLCFLMTHFCQHQLPETLTECKALIRQHFPIVYDTKILSTETLAAAASSDASAFLLGGAITNTRLDGLFDRYGRHGGVLNAVQVVSSAASSSSLHNGRNGNHHHHHHPGAAAPAVDDDQDHEAAYDAYMTGVCFIGLIHDIQQGIQLPLPGSADYHEAGGNDDDNNNHDEKDDCSDANNNHDDDYDDDDDDEEEGELDVSTIESDTQKLVRVILSNDETAKTSKKTNNNNNHDVRTLFGRNKLFQISMYTMDLEEPIRDPLSRGMRGESAFRISGFDPSISTRDIVRCLAGLVDSRGRRVNFEIIWIDDTTFIVAACWRPAPPSSVAAAANARAAAVLGAAALAAARADGGGGGGAAALVAAAAGAASMAAANASSESEDSTTILREHGQLVYDALTTRFSRDMIVNLNDYLDGLEAAAAAASATNAEGGKEASASSWTSRILGMFGLNKKRPAAVEDNENARSNKRRRLE